MGELPVEHGPQPVVADDHVAEPEVAVHDAATDGRRPVVVEPAQGQLERRMRLAERVEHLAVVVDLIDADEARDRRRVDGVDLDQRLGKLRRQRTPTR